MSNSKEFLDRIEALAKKLALAEQAGRDWSNRVVQLEVARDSLKGELKQATGEIETLRAQLATAGDNAELERLREFVGKVREAIKWWNDSNVGGDQLLFACKVDRWIGELDAANPAPVTEPTGGAE